MEIRELFVQAGVRSGGPILNPDSSDDIYRPLCPQSRCKVLGVIKEWISRFWTKYIDIEHAWLKEVRGHLITAATLTATMAYQAILSPPGSVWQDTGNLNQALAPAPSDESRSERQPLLGARKEPGAAIMNSYDEPLYGLYLVINTLMLVTSLSTIMLALSGFPITNKFLLWLLIFTMYTTISCMAISYFLVLDVVFPSLDETYGYLYGIIIGQIFIWFGVIGLVLMLHACHFLVWLGKKFWNLIKICRCLCNKFGNLVKICRTRGRGGGGGGGGATLCCWQP